MAVSWHFQCYCGARSTCAFIVGLCEISAVVVEALRRERGHSRERGGWGAAVGAHVAHLKEKELAEGAIPYTNTEHTHVITHAYVLVSDM